MKYFVAGLLMLVGLPVVGQTPGPGVDWLLTIRSTRAFCTGSKVPLLAQARIQCYLGAAFTPSQVPELIATVRGEIDLSFVDISCSFTRNATVASSLDFACSIGTSRVVTGILSVDPPAAAVSTPVTAR